MLPGSDVGPGVDGGPVAAGESQGFLPGHPGRQHHHQVPCHSQTQEQLNLEGLPQVPFATEQQGVYATDNLGVPVPLGKPRARKRHSDEQPEPQPVERSRRNNAGSRLKEFVAAMSQNKSLQVSVLANELGRSEKGILLGSCAWGSFSLQSPCTQITVHPRWLCP
jgi:hypothetical protein